MPGLRTWVVILRMRAGVLYMRLRGMIVRHTLPRSDEEAQPQTLHDAAMLRAGDLAETHPGLVLAPAEAYLRPPAGYLAEVRNPEMEALNARYAASPKFHCPEARALILEDAVVFDAGTVMTREGDLIADTFNIGNRRVVNRVERRGEGRAALSLPVNIPRIPGTALLCKKIGSSNYAHYLLEMLPRIPLARAAMAEGFDHLKLILPDPPGALSAVITQSLEALGVRAQVMRTGTDFVGRFERLIVPYALSHHPHWIHPAAIRAIEAMAPQATSQRRLFISRQDASKRRLINEDEVFARLQAVFPDMERVFCARLDFAEQQELFAEARDVVAVMGASFCNLVFAPRHGRVVCLGPGQFTDLFFRNLAAQKELDYLEVRGTPATDRPHAAFSLSDRMINATIAFLKEDRPG